MNALIAALALAILAGSPAHGISSDPHSASEKPKASSSKSPRDTLKGTYSTIDGSGGVLRISQGAGGQLQVSVITSGGSWDKPQALRPMAKDNDFLKDREFASAVETGYETNDRGGAFFVMKKGAVLYGEKVPARYMWFPYVYLNRR